MANRAAPVHAMPNTVRPAATPEQLDEWLTIIEARPLFSPVRRPSPSAPAMQPVYIPPRLTGTLVTATGRTAIFAASPAPLVVGEGGQVGALYCAAHRAGPSHLARAGRAADYAAKLRH